ncbi:histidine kinase [Actinokineospora globicatena]|nr:histidine kinase [Actinokineospora globicatena]
MEADIERSVTSVDRQVAVSGEPRVTRRRSGRAVAGVAGGLADHLGIPVLWARVAFTLLAALGGAGVVAYGLLWIFVPQVSAEEPAPEITGRERQQAFGLVALGIGLAIGAGTLAGTVNGWVAGATSVALVGAALIWREADQGQRRKVRGAVFGGGGRSAVIRVLSGAALVASGIVIFLISSIGLDQVQFALLAVVAALVGVAVITVPWWLRLVRDLGEERRARIRTEERAEIAAHLHDSVLQTLALIQKQAEAPREVLRLARGQERQLRSWLYGPSGYGRGAEGLAGGSLAEALARAAGEVEDTFAIKVQHVAVGDCELDDKLVAVVMAARESMVNAAKHAGVAEVSVYAEVEPEKVTVFVRDRGKGFDPEAVPDDRHGLADSIRGRMERNGGEITLRTAPGDGTEVQLHMPRAKVTT